jgi:hypothetical protein
MCLTRNDSEKTKCLCCENVRPNSDDGSKTITSVIDKSKGKFSIFFLLIFLI